MNLQITHIVEPHGCYYKAFYREGYSIDEMNHINFDWYRPKNCHRYTKEEIVQWCNDAGMEIKRMKIEEAGITVIATRIENDKKL